MSERVAVRGIGDLPTVGPAALCMGVFDGVHRGHLALVAATVAAARERGVASVALVFDPHPDEVVRPGTMVPRLAPLGENLRRLARAGIDHAFAVRFDPALRSLDPDAFLAATARSLALRALVMTPESAFGRNRAGTPDAMRELGARSGFDLVLAERVEDAGTPISSARVRAALGAGDLATVLRLLGHPLYLEAELLGADGGLHALRFDYLPALPGPGGYPAAVRPLSEDGPGRDGAVPARLVVSADGVQLGGDEVAGGGRVAVELPGAGEA